MICPKHIIAKNVADALAEDKLIESDWTSNLILTDNLVNAIIVTKEDMVFCGKAWADLTFTLCDNDINIDWQIDDGQWVAKGQSIALIKGRARSILTAERTALNFLQTLSATATIVAQYVKLIADLPVKLMDTRKTIPGLRLAQKYAVVVGGGFNQRHGLYDGVLIKENHIMACGGINQVLDLAYANTPKHIPIQIEIENLEQLKEALEAKAKLILLDNMSLDQLHQCVSHNQGRAILEASGNINLTNVRDYALTGVDRISIGALTKNIHAIDLSLRIKL